MLVFLAFVVQFLILENTREKNCWLRFIPIAAAEIFPLYMAVYDRKMYALYGTAHPESAIPLYGIAILAGYVLAW